MGWFEIEKNAIGAGLMKKRMNSVLYILNLRYLWNSHAGGVRYMGTDFSHGLKNLHLRIIGTNVEAEVVDKATQVIRAEMSGKWHQDIHLCEFKPETSYQSGSRIQSGIYIHSRSSRLREFNIEHSLQRC